MRQFEGVGEPQLSAVVAAAKEVHVAEFGAGLCRRRPVIVGKGDLSASNSFALFVESPE